MPTVISLSPVAVTAQHRSIRRSAAQHRSVRRSAAQWMLLAVLAFLLQLVLMKFVIGAYDEGLSLYGALRVFHGQLPYRDFWTMYGPGEFYVLAAAFHLFGVYAVSGRALFLITNTASLLAIVHILDEFLERRGSSLAITFMVLVWISTIGSYEFPVYPALTFILIATVLMLDRWRTARPHLALYAGVMLGFAALFRHDLAFYALVALGVASVVYETMAPAARRPARWHRVADVARLAAGALIIVLPVAILLLIFVPAHDLYYGLFYVPARIYPKVRALPFPHLQEVVHGFRHPWHFNEFPELGDSEFNIVWFPVLVGITTLLWLVPVFRRRALECWRAVGFLSLLLLTALLFLKGIIRVQPLHMLQAVVPAIVLFGCLVVQRKQMHRAAQCMLVLSGLWLAGCFLGVVHRDVDRLRVNLARLHRSDGDESFSVLCHPPTGLQRARCLSLNPTEEQAILYLESQTKPTDKIFVGSDRHDILLANDISFYFFSGRGSATKWHDLHPGVETTAPIQRQMINDLTRHRAVYVIREASPLVEPNASSISSGVHLLDDYIDRNYRADRSFGSIHLLRRCTPF